jgi:hypothetical protein
MADSNVFLAKTGEKELLNQYWYSSPTIAAMVAEVQSVGGSAAFLSTPSVYFSVPKADRAAHKVFDYDNQWASDPGYHFWDFKTPLGFPAELQHTFDVVVIDPPFITREVWEQYAQAAKALLKVDTDGNVAGKVIASTIFENAALMKELLNCEPQRYLPSIPHLVYQYNFFCNFPTTHLSLPNPEIPED